jgi:hypothetical protein
VNTAIDSEMDLRRYTGPDGRGWICDNCGETIRNAGDGWVQWLSFESKSGDRKARDLLLVHHFPASPQKESHEHGCQFDEQLEFRKDRSIVSDLSLDHFCGPDGLMHLLSLFVDERIPRRDLLEMIMRIHTPGYERARFHFDRAIAEGVIEPNLPEGFHWQRDIAAVLRWAERQKH